MRLAAEPITITINGASATLRPSLRAAHHLERKHGFPKLIEGIRQSDVTLIAEVIRYGADNDTVLPALLRQIDNHGAFNTERLKPFLYEFIMALIGADETSSDDEGSGNRITFAELFTSLFEIGTGWLGWTPTATWDATPGEILAAHRGLVAKLRAINGQSDSSDDAASDLLNLPSDDEVKEGIAKLKEIAKR